MRTSPAISRLYCPLFTFAHKSFQLMTFSLFGTTARGLIFDMDGTMVDNMMAHHRAWQRQLQKMGLEMTLEEVQQQIHGVNEEILARLFGGQFTAEERRHYARAKEAEYREGFKDELQLIDGLPEVLQRLHQAGLPMGIGTAAPAENVDFVLDALQLRPYFGAVRHAGDVKKGKPDPEIFQLVAEGIGLPVEECIIFEDSPTGAEAAARAGSPLVVVTTTHRPEEFGHLPNVIQFISDYRGLPIAFG